MLKRKKQENNLEKKVKVADSTVKLITKELLVKLGIILPLTENAIDTLLDYFETEEIGLAKDQELRISYDEQYMKDICQAVNDLSPCGDNEVTDIDDLNARLNLLN